MKRRDFMRTAGGATAAVAATSVATAQEDDGGGDEDDGGADEGDEGAEGGGGGDVQPEWPSAVEGGNVGSYLDARGQEEVTVVVGAGEGLAFDPTKLWVDPGTTITFEWTGAGGDHNVVTVDGPLSLESDISADEGFTYTTEVTEDDAGITHYHCAPHAQVGMDAGIAVGDDVPTVEAGGATDGWPESVHDIGVPLHAHWVGVVSGVAIALTFVFTFYVLKYGESAHTGHGDR